MIVLFGHQLTTNEGGNMEDFIRAHRMTRQAAQDFLSANPTTSTVVAGALFIDRAGVEHSRPGQLSAVEDGISNWLYSAWREAADPDTGESWDAMCHMLFGALQACLNRNELDAYVAYSFLATIARERRHRAIVDCVGFGDDE